MIDINDKVARCRLIATMIVADDFVEEVELELLEKAMSKLDLSEEEKAKVMVLLDEDQALEALGSLTDEERSSFLDDLADVAWVDGHLDDYEVEQIRSIAAAMDVGENSVQDALERARERAS